MINKADNGMCIDMKLLHVGFIRVFKVIWFWMALIFLSLEVLVLRDPVSTCYDCEPP